MKPAVGGPGNYTGSCLWEKSPRGGGGGALTLGVWVPTAKLQPPFFQVFPRRRRRRHVVPIGKPTLLAFDSLGADILDLVVFTLRAEASWMHIALTLSISEQLSKQMVGE